MDVDDGAASSPPPPLAAAGARTDADAIGAAQASLQVYSKALADALWAVQQLSAAEGAAAAGAAAAARVNEAAAVLDTCIAALPDYDRSAAAVTARLEVRAPLRGASGAGGAARRRLAVARRAAAG
jgi:hypothetical protein